MLQEDRQFYENLAGKQLSEQEFFEAKSNFVGFFNLLFEIDQRIKEKTNDHDNRSSNIPDKA